VFLMIRNGHVYDPEDVGVADLLVAGGKIVQVGPGLPALPDWLGPIVEVDASGKRVVPGFIDSHLHLTGGGGNDSYASRIPDLQLSDLTRAGITTAVSCLGVDPIAKTLDSMLMKALGMEEEGITTFIYAGSFVFGEPTFFGDLRRDLTLIEKMLGIKIALAESRGSHPPVEELARLASEAYSGGLLSGKPGCLNIHLGQKDEDPYPLLSAALQRSGVPPDRFVATHVNYTSELLDGALAFAGHGTYLNVDSILAPRLGVTRAVEPHLAVARMLEAGIPVERIGMSSDGNASVPRLQPDGSRGPYRLGFDTMVETVGLMVDAGLDVPTALKTVTSTPARMLGLQGRKGYLRPGMDADIVTLDDGYRVRDVWARGVRHVKDGVAVVLGMYESPTPMREATG
jgi:beta-aspartyl-dipeptidase (metallo-type)